MYYLTVKLLKPALLLFFLCQTIPPVRAQDNATVLEEWTITMENDTMNYPFYQITFFEDSIYALDISYDSSVYASYHIRKDKLYLSYLPEDKGCYKRKKNFYVIPFYRGNNGSVELFYDSKRKPLVYTVNKL